MPFYRRQGEIPRKRHTAFRKKDGSLYFEELISREGFSGVYSNLYHLAMPTRVKAVGAFQPSTDALSSEAIHRPRHVKTADVRSSGDFVNSRRLLFFNSDVRIHKAHPTENSKSFHRNGHHDELIFVHRGRGTLLSQFGALEFTTGDYLVIPRGVVSQVLLKEDPGSPASFLIVESASPIQTPRRYRNAFGQLLEHSPFCERDIRTPELAAPRSEAGEFEILVRLRNGRQKYVYDHHPFDVVGWDGYLFPWAFNIRDFEPIVGRIHQPPPIHQTFEGGGFVVCSFVSRPFDFHPDAIPAPYPHSNVDSDEILFYSEGEFMSRTGIAPESITHHPMGLAHGPQPGKYEESIGKKSTEELAVMIDTFAPLSVAQDAALVEDTEYASSWIPKAEKRNGKKEI
ncbi:MAG: homogentisate 1,2-dioxygenase [Deltaproteobacteria bacterium]|nr:homogentisate 1,2-dioxygenase [Deltaproteobacteria bacterium]